MKYISDYIVPIGPEGLYIIDTGKWRTRRPEMDIMKCKKCGTCFLYCPVHAVKRHEDKSYTIDYTYCKGCGICANECRFDSIEMIPEEGDSDA